MKSGTLVQNAHSLNLSVNCVFRTRISQMVVIAMTQKAVENKKNFGTRICTDLHGLLFGVNIVVNFEF